MEAPAATRGTARLVAVVALLLGLLAMHGVAGAHHAAAAPVGFHAAAPAASTHTDPHASHLVGPGSTRHAAALTGPSDPACQDDCAGGAAVLCVAVLTAMAVALLLARRRGSPLVATPATRQGLRSPAPPARHARGPDPVRELCISRT